MNAKLLVIFLLWSLPAFGQGFAGLGASGEGFAQPQRGTLFTFPKDHAAHPEFRIEWWYLTANLQDGQGRDYGVQWTLFRTALAPTTGAGWSDPQLWMGHAAVTTSQTHRSAERLARGGIGQAGVSGAPFEAFIDDWQMAGPDLSDLSVRANAPDFSYDLELKSKGPLVFHGDQGYSQKSDRGQASYYYAQPGYNVNGVLIIDGEETVVHGQAWLDREWSSQPLAPDQLGWDWFSLHLEDGRKLMVFRLRHDGGGHYLSGSLIAQDGQVTTLNHETIVMTPLQNTPAPSRWTLRLPDHGIDLKVTALNPDSWMDTFVRYWEGPVRAEGSHDARGYLEMTGY